MNVSDLAGFPPIALEEMNDVSLLKRVDTKFLTTESKLSEILSLLHDEYQILEIAEKRLMNYTTLYLTQKT